MLTSRSGAHCTEYNKVLERVNEMEDYIVEHAIQGEQGYMGQSGYSGWSGHSGMSGYSGFSGASGYSGWSGLKGEAAASGYSGWSGASGQSGWSGFSGISGKSGYSGQSGISGYSGWSGQVGISGYSGQSGASGYSGWSGRIGSTVLSGITIDADKDWNAKNLSNVGTLGCGAITSSGGMSCTGSITQNLANYKYHILNRAAISNDTGLVLSTAGTSKWVMGLPVSDDSQICFYNNPNGNVFFIKNTGYINVASGYEINGTRVFTGMNLTNIGTVGCGAITSSGDILRVGSLKVPASSTSWKITGQSLSKAAGQSGSVNCSPSTNYYGFVPIYMSFSTTLVAETNPGSVYVKALLDDGSTTVTIASYNGNSHPGTGTRTLNETDFIVALGTRNGRYIKYIFWDVSGGQNNGASFSSGLLYAWQF